MAKKRKRADGIYKHASGQWAKTVDRKTVYLGCGSVSDAKRKLDELLARRTLGQGDPVPDGITVEQLSRMFLASKSRQAVAGKITTLTLANLEHEMKWLCNKVGGRQAETLRGYDFTRLAESLPDGMAASSINTKVQRVRSLFSWAVEQELLDRVPKYGDFKRATGLQERRERADSGSRVFTADEVHGLLEASSDTFRAMILVGLNCAADGASIGRLKHSEIDGDWLKQTRKKVGTERNCWLWPETLEAIELVRTDSDYVFLNSQGRPFDVIERPKCITNSFKLIKDRAGITRRIGFHSFRHTFATVARYLPANDRTIREVTAHIHQTGDVLNSRYVQGVDRSEIKRLCEGVRLWLFDNEHWSQWQRWRSGDLSDITTTEGEVISQQDWRDTMEGYERQYPFLR